MKQEGTTVDDESFYRGVLICLQQIYSHDAETIFREVVAEAGEKELLKVARKEKALEWSGLRKYGYCKRKQS